ncbi:hypothetical protein L4D09_11040 [Photobacterium makurazakiensis]|uniref:hypothetical protein n=1 Tax=Photobacterium makurazakiensis TaxID=2910234 RepID=UPI003D0CC2BD
MANRLNKLVISTLICTSPMVFSHEDVDSVINPDDLQDVTKVNPQAALYVTSDANIRVSGMFSGKWNENVDFAGFAEGIFGDRYGDDSFDGDYLGGRAQYFQVHATGNSYIPRIGFSTDLIHQKNRGLDDTSLFSAGIVAAIDGSFTPGFQVFPNVAYSVGEVFGETADGYLANLFVSTPIGDNGSFLLLWPEYFDVSGDNVELESKSLNFVFQSPIKNNYGQWFVTKLAYNETDITLPNGSRIEGDGDVTLEFGVKWYF